MADYRLQKARALYEDPLTKPLSDIVARLLAAARLQDQAQAERTRLQDLRMEHDESRTP